MHQSGAPVTVIAQYRARAGTGDEIATVLARHVAATRAEPGCLSFIAYRDADDPDHFTLFEQYVDEEAFEAHRRSEHFATYVEGRIAPLLDERRWRRCQVVPEP